MEIVVGNLSSTGAFQSLCTNHGGKSIRWNTQTHAKLKFTDVDQVFIEVNQFWASLPEEAQLEIFEAYENIHERLTKPDDVDDHEDLVKDQVAVIYRHFTAKDAENIVNGLNLTYPSTMSEDYGEGGDNGRTYRRSDYHRLVQLAIRLRPMLPIFGQYIRLFVDQPGSQYRESAAARLLAKTDVLTQPAVDKLVGYMEGAVANFKHKNSVILNSLGSYELPYWLVAKALFRRVAPGEVHSIDDVSSIVTNVFNFVVKSTLDSVPRNFGGTKLKTRTAEGSSKSDENISLLESIRVREQIPRGRKVFVNVYSRSILATAVRVDPSVPHDLVESCCRITNERVERGTHSVQETLAAWTLSRGAPPSHYDLLGLEGSLRWIGAAQALLWHWGYIELAALMEAAPALDTSLAPMASLWVLNALSKDRLDKLRQRFPHTIPLTRRDQNPDEANVGVADITELARQIYSEEWILSKDSRLYDKVSHNEQGYIILPPGFRNTLADLLLEVSSGTW